MGGGGLAYSRTMAGEALSYATIYHVLGTAHTSWPSVKLRTQDGRQASGPQPSQSHSVQPHLPLESMLGPAGRSRVFFYLARCLIVRPNYAATATVSYSTIYSIPWTPSSLAWVQRTQAGLLPNSAHKLAIRPLALCHHNPTVCSLACWIISNIDRNIASNTAESVIVFAILLNNQQYWHTFC